MTSSDDLQRLVERIEKLGDQDQGIRWKSAIRRSRPKLGQPPPLAEITLFGERAEIVMAMIEESREIAAALRARITQEKSNG